MELNECRQEIDKINNEMLELFLKRMDLCALVADYKQKNNLPILQPEREKEILKEIAEKSGEEMAGYSASLFSTVMALSRSYQAHKHGSSSQISLKLSEAINSTPKDFPESAVVACQGIQGAYSSIAANKLFKNPQILYFKNFDGVFSAIEQGLCRYGILPIENSLHGSVNQVYSLMQNHNFYIAKSIKLKINHVLLAKDTIPVSEITDIYSHEQAIGQCSDFLKKYPNIRVHVCENTAIAARLVAESVSKTAASVSSPECGEIYGLKIIGKDIANADNNYTRFICISRALEIYENSDKISLVLHAEHKPGALHTLISRLSGLNINITKLESRPIAGSEFEYIFYFDIEASAFDPQIIALLGELCRDDNTSAFLGCYSEI